MSEMKKHRVAVVVFMDVEAVDEQDAGNVADMMLRDVIRLVGSHRILTSRDNVWEGEIHSTMELGMAAGNGYLWTRPTGKAWQEFGFGHWEENSNG